MKKVLLILTAIFCFSLPALATVKVVDVDGASDFDLTQSTPVIFGGTGGTDCSPADDLFSTCNSCESLTTLEVCNTSRIYDGLVLRIYFQSDSTAGVAFINDSSGNPITLNNTPKSKAKGETHLVELTWLNACVGTGSADGSTCENDDIQGTLTVGVDPDGEGTNDTSGVSVKVHDPDPTGTGDFDTIEACTAGTVTTGGICDFRAYPGDAKIYIDQLGKSSGFPTSGNITIKSLRFFVSSEDDLNRFIANPNEGRATDLEVATDASGNPEITSRVIDGLTNEKLHFVRVATVDQANNVSRFTSNAAIDDYCVDNTNPADGCIFTAKPDEVLGLLEDDLNCFVASVSYGSAWDSRVGTFRRFRSNVLRHFSLGQSFIDWYYKQGPHLAAWIVKNPEFKPIVRTMLWPALGFAWTANQVGLPFAMLITLILFCTMTLVIFKVRQHMKSRVPNEK